MTDHTRPVGWIRAARKAYAAFPAAVQDRVNSALTIAAEGSRTDIAKPLKGFGLSVWQIAVRYKTDAYRVVWDGELDGSYVGNTCLQEEIEDWNQDSKD